MRRWTLLILLATICLWRIVIDARADAFVPLSGRFFHSGDGQINLRSDKSGAKYQGRYRMGADDYDPEAYQSICGVFGAPCTSGGTLSLRLIEFIDALEDHFSPGAEITITSGYRSPSYNTRLREKGSLAAKASLHQYGMAADLKIAGVPAKRIWEHVKALGFGGAGYYHGETVHIDVGPARSWDEKSSGVGTGISDNNKLIGLVADFDIYRSGQSMLLRFIRMTAFPIGVLPEFILYRQSEGSTPGAVFRFVPGFTIATDGPCPLFGDISRMDGIQWDLPASLAPGNYRIGARFCNSPWLKMPAEVNTPVFQVVGS